LLAGCGGVGLFSGMPVSGQAVLVSCAAGGAAKDDNTAGEGERDGDTAGGPAGALAWAEAEALAAAVSSHAARERAASILGTRLAPAAVNFGAAAGAVTAPLTRALSRSAAAAVSAPAGRLLLRAEAVPLAISVGIVAWVAARRLLRVLGTAAGRPGRNRVRWAVRRARQRIARAAKPGSAR
jgi:hypothetical protein